MTSDKDIEADVVSELLWSPDLDERDIAVKVNGGVVTLTGFARNYLQKAAAETAAKRVAGVAAIANDIEVRLPTLDALPDPEIAREAISAIRRDIPIIADKVRVLVHQGHVTLEGEVEWYFQRNMAASAVRPLKGVVDVMNLLGVRPRVAPAEVKQRIEDAFRRSAAIDAGHISVAALGGEVTLRGRVRSWLEREEAQRTAWSAPGVTQVKNEIAVGY